MLMNDKSHIEIPTTPKGGVWQKILTLLFENIGQVVPNETIMETSQQHNYARRIRELRAEGWQIKYNVRPSGYILESEKQLPKEAGEYVNLRLRTEVLERDNYICQICGYGRGEKYIDGERVRLEVDHIIPLAEGGKTIVDNLQTLCARCNAGKKSKIAYSVTNEDEVSLVIHLPKELEETLQKEADEESITIKDLIVRKLDITR